MDEAYNPPSSAEMAQVKRKGSDQPLRKFAEAEKARTKDAVLLSGISLNRQRYIPKAFAQ
jgi:hypothetical protein